MRKPELESSSNARKAMKKMQSATGAIGQMQKDVAVRKQDEVLVDPTSGEILGAKYKFDEDGNKIGKYVVDEDGQRIFKRYKAKDKELRV